MDRPNPDAVTVRHALDAGAYELNPPASCAPFTRAVAIAAIVVVSSISLPDLAPAQEPLEPNDTIAQSVEISAPEELIEAMIETTDDVDFFKLYVVRRHAQLGVQLANELPLDAGPESGEVSFRLFDGLPGRRRPEFVGVGESAMFLEVGLLPGRYFVKVRGTEAALPYSLYLSGHIGSFEDIKQRCRRAKRQDSERNVRLYCSIPS